MIDDTLSDGRLQFAFRKRRLVSLLGDTVKNGAERYIMVLVFIHLHLWYGMTRTADASLLPICTF